MNESPAVSNDTLVLKRIYNCPVEKLYRAWTDPNEVAKWWAHSDWDAYTVEIDLKVGGEFKWGLDNRVDGKRFTAVGKFIEIVPNEMIVMSWKWIEGNYKDAETVLMVQFLKADSGSELILTHSKHPDQALLEDHKGGWAACMERLTAII